MRHPRNEAGPYHPGPSGEQFRSDELADIGQAIIITEGEFKALASTQHGFACIGLVGVYGWAEKKKESLLPEMERIAWQGRKVYIAFDSDITDNPNVQDAEARLAAHLTNRGAIVKVVRIPAGPPDLNGKPTKLGLDDYLVTQDDPKRAMRDLLDKAEDPPPQKTIDVRNDARDIDSTREGPAFIDRSTHEGMPRLRFWRDGWQYWQGGAYREHQPGEVRAKLVKFLMQKYYRIAQSHTSNVLDVAKAEASGATLPSQRGRRNPGVHEWRAPRLAWCGHQIHRSDHDGLGGVPGQPHR